MSDIVLIDEWVAPYPSNWRDNLKNLAESCRDAEVSKMEAQFYFSHIIRTEEWREEMIWEDWVTNKIYESEDEIPDDVRTISQTQRWKNQSQFIDWCSENIVGFTHATFWNRHRVIDKWTEVGMDLADAVKIVAGLSAVTSSSLVLDIFEFDQYNHCLGFNPELARKLPTLSDDAKESISKLASHKRSVDRRRKTVEETGDVELQKQLDQEEKSLKEAVKEHLSEVAGAAEQYIKEKSLPIQDKATSPRIVSSDIKREIYQKPKCRIRYVEDGAPFPFVWLVDWPNESGYTVRTDKFYIQLIDENGEVLKVSDIPEDALDWLHNRLSMYQQLSRLGKD